MKTVLNPNRKALKVENVIYRSAYDFRTTADDLKQAFLELGETEEKRVSALLELKETLIGDRDFYYLLDDEYLLRYLRYKKFDVKKTYTIIRKFYAFRKERPDLFDVPHNVDYFLKREFLKILPYRNEKGCVVLWIDTNNWKLDEMSVWELFTTVQTYSDVLTMNPSIQVNGSVGLWDVGGATASHLARLSYPTTLKIFLASLQTFYPYRMKQVILINFSPMLLAFYNSFRFLLPKKIADRVVLLGSDMTELHRHLNPRILPKVYGGYIETSECIISQYIKDNLPYVEYERSFGRNMKDIS